MFNQHINKTIINNFMKNLILFIFILNSISINSYSQTVTYQYDDLNRLTSADYGNGTVISYTYDANGNRLTETVSSGSYIKARLVLEGFYYNYDNYLQRKDTVKGYLMNITPPYSPVDSSVVLLDTLTFEALFKFNNAPTGTYYLKLKHLNSIETWSKSGGLQFTRNSTTDYDFTKSQDMAYGNNLIQIDSFWCIHGGDIDQNGIINLTDLLPVSNASNLFETGYTVRDVTGDNKVDLTDIILILNNSGLFVTVKKPF